jgi:glycine oxidase
LLSIAAAVSMLGSFTPNHRRYNCAVNLWDAIIIGGGIIGLSLARELNRRGLCVLVVDKGEPGRESSYAAGGMLADSGDENPPLLQPLMTASARLYPEFAHELQDESGQKVDLRSDGTITLAETPPSPQHPSSRALDHSELAVLEQALAPGNLSACWLPERSVDPRALAAAALKACRHRGVQISSGDAAVSVTLSDGRTVGLATAKTSFTAPVVVNCAGAWACQIAPVRFPTRPMKGQMLCVAMPEPNFLRHVVRSPDVYLIPRSDGRLLIGATVEDAGYDKRVDPDTIQHLRQRALWLVPGLSEARMLEDWAGLRPGTPDGLPILGTTPVPGYFVATGHFRDGILLAPITAKLMAELIVDGRTQWDISSFSAERFS